MFEDLWSNVKSYQPDPFWKYMSDSKFVTFLGSPFKSIGYSSLLNVVVPVNVVRVYPVVAS